MNCNPTLTADEFKTIHNSLYYLDCLNNEKVSEIVEQMRGALKNAYDQDNDAFDKKYVHYNQVKKELGLETTWSLYEVNNLSERHPFDGAKQVVYKDYNTDKDVVVNVNGLTWAALYVAANACILNSTDNHHTFIEHFEQSSVNPEILFLTTGS